MNAIAISARIAVPIAIVARIASRAASLFASVFVIAVCRMCRPATPISPAITIEKPIDSSVRRLRPGASTIASTHSSGTRIVNSSASLRIPLPTSSIRLSLSDLNRVSWPAPGGSFDTRVPGVPSREATF